MTDGIRKRIDVSSEAHARLEAEARRRGVPLRDLVEQAIAEMLDRSAQAALSVRQQRERRHADRIEEQTAQINELGRRLSALIGQQTSDLPAALRSGFEAIKATIRETGGTGHLRDMIKAFETDFATRFSEANVAVTGSVGAVTEAVNRRGDRIEKQVAEIRGRLAARRKIFGLGLLAGLVFILLVGLIIPDTPPTRWLAVRFVGETDPARAAWTLAGDGRAAGRLMAETKGLLSDERFRDRYASCVDQSKRTNVAFPCRLTFPPLVNTTP